MKIRIIISFAIAFFLIVMISCQSQSNKLANNSTINNYATKFNREYHNKDLLLGCMIYAENAGKELNYDGNDDFLKIASDYFRSINPDNNIDSVIDSFIARKSNIDFNSSEAKRNIRNFVDNYNIVSNLIFGGIDSEDNVAEMKVLEEKIKKLPALFKIYNSYMEGRPDLSSLSSTEGNALYIELGFYLSNQDIKMRNDILKQLL